MRRLIILTCAVVLAAVVAGCGSSPEPRFYTLDPAAAAGDARDVSVVVAQAAIPQAVDRPQIVVRAGENRVAIEEFQRWASPLKDEIPRVVALNLARLLGSARVASSVDAIPSPDYRVLLDVQRFESVPGESATVEVLWTVRGKAGAVKSGRTLTREAPAGKDYSSLAAAHSRALAAVSRDIAAAIRELASR
jgi:uncharacterized lipoprotein YmbA